MFSLEIFTIILNEYDFTNFHEIKQISVVNKTFYSIIKKLLLNVTLKYKNDQYYLTVNEESEYCDDEIYKQMIVLFDDWIINDVYFRNRNNYYKSFIYECKKFLIPKNLYNFRLENYFHICEHPSDHDATIINIHTSKLYEIEDINEFNIFDSNESAYIYSTIGTKDLFFISFKYIRTQFSKENLNEI
ncbi:8169_t:CDS:1 [Cetraspora pellucida]|uniref:8169_t:CDS:1 n=1 Tax=Cetraspora pellucida TaxID=1433469 RepID=A0ACA9NKT0_9GLOM|nr:8169_t:CDS:1 [Cetraspora pellucida]